MTHAIRSKTARTMALKTFVIATACALVSSITPARADGNYFPNHQNYEPQCYIDSVGQRAILGTAPIAHSWNNDSFVINGDGTSSGVAGWELIWWTTVIGYYDANGQYRYHDAGGWLRKLDGGGTWQFFNRNSGNWEFRGPSGTATTGHIVGNGTYDVYSIIYWGSQPWPNGVHVQYTGSCTFRGSSSAGRASQVAREAPVPTSAADVEGALSKRKVPAKQPRHQKLKCTVKGTSARDVLKGSRHPDVICGRGGNDRITAGHGDIVLGGKGGDTLRSRGHAVLLGGRGDDRLYSRNSKVDIVTGGRGKDGARFDGRDKGNGSVEGRL